MKKIYFSLLLISLLTFSTAKATNHMVSVENFAFVPATLDVLVGDTITWNWASGSHTTTSTDIPAGAAPWDQVMNQNSQVFSYVVTKAGDYDYICVPHQASGMVGSFTATATTNAGEIILKPSVSVAGNPVYDQINLTVLMPHKTTAKILLYDNMGRVIRDFGTFRFNAGEISQSLPVNSILKGIYLLEVSSGDFRITRRVMIE